MKISTCKAVLRVLILDFKIEFFLNTDKFRRDRLFLIHLIVKRHTNIVFREKIKGSFMSCEFVCLFKSQRFGFHY